MLGPEIHTSTALPTPSGDSGDRRITKKLDSFEVLSIDSVCCSYRPQHFLANAVGLFFVFGTAEVGRPE